MQQLPLKKQIAYAFGMMGWSILINLINVILVYLYLPPANSGLPNLITQVVVFGLFNMIAFITASGRFIDAIYDPLIAQYSDTSKNPKGRRIPLMKLAILPSVFFCFFVFFPMRSYESSANIIWLIFMLIGFYVSTTTYIIPYNALLPELAPTPENKVTLATWQSLGYITGVAIGSNTFNVTKLLQTHFLIHERLSALQITILMMAVLAAIFMLIPTLAIDEKRYCIGKPSSTPLMPALKSTLKNKNFVLFIVADFSYYIAITLILSGLMYFVTVLLSLDESIGNSLIITMVVVSLLFYPLINYFSKRIGKKKLVSLSFFILSVVFSGIYILGKTNMDEHIQIFTLFILAAPSFAALNILPNAILAEVIEEDIRLTGENKEGIYFAVRYFFVKIAQTVGMALFAMLLIYGKDPGDDFGIRLNGVLGFILCLIAGFVFMRFKEKKH
ncbi:MAG TPA: MFS transporter [Bacteroidia bacterium]|jgi:GPH family glycoside/pentoside/hexuronide:cation symporter|nr:MFS transporter [Bacteroidia bacterium]